MAQSDGTTISPDTGTPNRVLPVVKDYRIAMLATLPTFDPHVAGAVWNSSGTPVVSAG